MAIAKGSPNHKHTGGRPPIYRTVEEMQAVIDKYFAECDPHWADEEYWDYPLNEETGKRDYSAKMVQEFRRVKTEQQPYTMAGLAIRLGMDRRTLIDYKKKNEFLPAIKMARNKVEEFNEHHLLTGKNVTGAIFLLKVNHGYRDTPEENPPPDNPIIFINNVPIGDEAPAETEAKQG